MRRDKPKDAYDVVWLIAGLGPELAASRVLESPLVVSEHGDAVRAQLGRLVEQFADRDGVGARSYADFLTSVAVQVAPALVPYVSLRAPAAAPPSLAEPGSSAQTSSRPPGCTRLAKCVNAS